MKLKLAIFLVLLYVLALIATFPARVAVKLAPLPASVHMNEVTGTIWNMQVGQLTVAERSLEAISIEVFPLALLTGKFAAQVQIARQDSNPFSLDGHVTFGLSGLHLEDWVVRGDLSKTSRWLQLPDLVPVRGDYTLELAEYMQGQPLCSALNARGAAFEVSTRIGQVWHGVGDYRVSLQCENGQVLVQMPAENMLGIQFDLNLTGAGYKLDGRLQPSASSPQAIRDILRVVGTPNAQGQYLFSAERP